MKIQSVFIPTIAIAVTVSAATLMPQTVQAASLTYETTPIAIFDQDTDAGLFASVNLPYFNAALGQLNRVTYQLIGNSTASITIVNNSTRDGSASGSSQMSILGIFRPNSVALSRSIVAGTSVSGALPKNGGTLLNAATTVQTDSESLTDASGLAAFTGAGNFDVDLFGEFNASGTASVSRYLVTSLGQSQVLARVIYDYTAIPTPALLPGLIGLGLGIVRKRKLQGQPEAE
jgi:hypothetical protein